MEEIALYHRVMRRENFEKAAKDLVALVRAAEEKSPGAPRTLFLDIDGHRNCEGGFDADMFELQKEFGLGFLLPYLTEVHFPLISARNEKEQRNDVPDQLEIFNAGEEKDHCLDDLCLENFSNTEYQSEETVYLYLKRVSGFLRAYQDLDGMYASLPPEPYDPRNLLNQWRRHIKELIHELFNLFVSGNLLSAAAMTRTLMECYAYVSVLKKEKSQQLLEDWYLCGMICSFSGWDEEQKQEGLKRAQELCRAWGRDPEKTVRRFARGNENEWLTSVLPGRRASFFQVCEYLGEHELYQAYKQACAFVHGQDVRAKTSPFLFYDEIYHQLIVIMSYTFKAIRLYPVPEELEKEMQGLEQDLSALWGTTSWDREE